MAAKNEHRGVFLVRKLMSLQQFVCSAISFERFRRGECVPVCVCVYDTYKQNM